MNQLQNFIMRSLERYAPYPLEGDDVDGDMFFSVLRECTDFRIDVEMSDRGTIVVATRENTKGYFHLCYVLPDCNFPLMLPRDDKTNSNILRSTGESIVEFANCMEGCVKIFFDDGTTFEIPKFGSRAELEMKLKLFNG